MACRDDRHPRDWPREEGRDLRGCHVNVDKVRSVSVSRDRPRHADRSRSMHDPNQRFIEGCFERHALVRDDHHFVPAGCELRTHVQHVTLDTCERLGPHSMHDSQSAARAPLRIGVTVHSRKLCAICSVMPTPAELKQRTKQLVRRVIGEPYVGKRLKMRSVSRVVRGMELAPRRIVDAGSEDATFAYWLADRFPDASVLAIDTDGQSIATCLSTRPRAYAQRVDFRASRVSDLPSETFDLVTAFDVLEHIEDDVGEVRQISRVLVPGGAFLLHVPRDQWTRADGKQERVPDSEAWRINPGHVRMGYGPEALAALVESVGFEVVEVDLWVRRWGTRAHTVYRRLEHPAPLRLLSVPFTDLASVLDRGRPAGEGNTVFLHARKPSRSEAAPDAPFGRASLFPDMTGSAWDS
jgi:SAM-dependent methyltransferase